MKEPNINRLKRAANFVETALIPLKSVLAKEKLENDVRETLCEIAIKLTDCDKQLRMICEYYKTQNKE